MATLITVILLCGLVPGAAFADSAGPGMELSETDTSQVNMPDGQSAEPEQAAESGQQSTQTTAEAWEAERNSLKLTRSFAGTVKPWLFYKDTWTERQQLFERGKQLWWYKKMINEKLYTPLTNAGIRLVIMVVPDKQTLYGEDYLPEELKAPLKSYDRVEQFMDYMKKEFPKLEIYYPKDDMLKAKEAGLPLYYSSDSHWNFVGAGVCAEGLMNYLGAEYALTEKPQFTYQLTGETAQGDLQQFEGLDESWNRVEYEILGTYPAEKVYSLPDTQTGEEIYAEYRSLDERALPKKLYFAGDSYRWYIQYALNGQFTESRFVQRYVFSAADALKHQPDVFVYELPERFLPQFASLID